MSNVHKIATLLRSIADLIDPSIEEPRPSGEAVTLTSTLPERSHTLSTIKTVEHVTKKMGADFTKMVDKATLDLPTEPTYTKPELDVFDLRSKCCGDKVIQRGGDEGTNHYECMRCGDACDTRHKDDEPEVEPEDGRKRKRGPREVQHPCCGSRNWKHKSGCGRSVSGDVGGNYKCDACEHTFTYTEGGVARCPECESENCWPKETT